MKEAQIEESLKEFKAMSHPTTGVDAEPTILPPVQVSRNLHLLKRTKRTPETKADRPTSPSSLMGGNGGGQPAQFEDAVQISFLQPLNGNFPRRPHLYGDRYI